MEIARPLRRHPWLGDAVGIAMFALGLALRFAVDGVLPRGIPFVTFFPAVILTTFFCGLRPGITCAALSTLAAWYFFIGPKSGMDLTSGQTLLVLAFFVGIVAIAVALIHFTFRAAEQLREERETASRLLENQRIMFQELQHRVANNMQFVAALLSLHKRRAADDPAHALVALDEAQVRLDTISRIHRRLYAPERLDMPTEQFLRELCSDLVSTSGVEGISCRVSSPDLPLNVTQLTTLSMLVAEIVTNSLKHAYVPGTPGQVLVTVVPCDQPRRYEIAIADDGRGLPAGVDLARGKGLGWRIVQGLATQLGGQAELAGGAAGRGTVVTVQFTLA